MLFQALCYFVLWQGACAQRLFFSEYVLGTGGAVALEIFNPSCATVDVSDFRLLVAAGGGPWNLQSSVDLSTLSSSGEFWIVLLCAHPRPCCVAVKYISGLRTLVLCNAAATSAWYSVLDQRLTSWSPSDSVRSACNATVNLNLTGIDAVGGRAPASVSASQLCE